MATIDVVAIRKTVDAIARDDAPLITMARANLVWTMRGLLDALDAALESASVARLDAALLTADTLTVSELLTAHRLTLANAATVTGYLHAAELRANSAIVDADTLVVVGTADIRRLNCVAVVTTGNIETTTLPTSGA